MRRSGTLHLFWLLTLLTISVFAGSTWVEIVLNPEAGGQQIHVTGNHVFPVTAALLLLQAAGLLTSYFAPDVFGRFIAGSLAIGMMTHLVSVGLEMDAAMDLALSAEISEATGILGLTGQNQFLESITSNLMWVGYVLAMALNIIVLITRAILKQRRGGKSSSVAFDETTDLWESQS